MSEQDFDVVQEPERVARGKIIAVAISAVIIGGLGVLASALLIQASIGQIKIDTITPGQAQRPASVHIGEVKQTDIYLKAWGKDLLSSQKEDLKHYRWVDKDHGVAQIPIDKAIDIVVEKSR